MYKNTSSDASNNAASDANETIGNTSTVANGFLAVVLVLAPVGMLTAGSTSTVPVTF